MLHQLSYILVYTSYTADTADCSVTSCKTFQWVQRSIPPLPVQQKSNSEDRWQNPLVQQWNSTLKLKSIYSKRKICFTTQASAAQEKSNGTAQLSHCFLLCNCFHVKITYGSYIQYMYYIGSFTKFLLKTNVALFAWQNIIICKAHQIWNIVLLILSRNYL